MAYKLLVADDEYWVREKFRHIIDWSRYDIEFLEPVCDGLGVLEYMEREKLDILITDINMPGLNGVDLLETLARQHPEIVMLVISGYDSFDYVKRSMRSGAINYLLKPVSKIDLVSAVSEALQILHEQQLNSQEQAMQQEQLVRASSLLQDRELSMLLDQQRIDKAPTLTMNVPLNVVGYNVVLMKIHDMRYAMETYHQDINSLSYTVKSKLQKLPEAQNTIIFNYFSRSNEFILLADRRENRSVDALRKYQQLMEELFRSPVTVVVSEQSYDLSNIRMGYLWAENQLWRRRFAPSSEVVLPGMQSQPDDEQLKWNPEMGKLLQAYLANGNRDMVSHAILEKSGLGNVDRVQVSCAGVTALLRKINHELVTGGLSTTEDMMAVANLEEEVLRTVETLRFEDVWDRENELIDAVMTVRPDEQIVTIKDVIHRIQDEIDLHYYEPLTLTSLAQKYSVDHSYLSRCFKQETSENLMMYLAKRRMEKAVEHMKEGKVGLTEISFLVGYDDYTYFSRVFKKVMGMSPREYKIRYLEGDAP